MFPAFIAPEGAEQLSQYSDQATDWTTCIRFPAGKGISFLHHRVQTGSVANQAAYPMGNGGYFPGVKWTGREAKH
jgi:hypothetical protein